MESGPDGSAAAGGRPQEREPGIAPRRPARDGTLAALGRIGLPIALWMVFVNAASQFHDKGGARDGALREAVEAELASRHCPGLHLDPAGFRKLARERGINHADLYQARSPRLRKDAAHLARALQDDPEGGCQRMLDLYGGADPHLLSRT